MRSDIAEKWGMEVAENGFAQLPNYLILLNQFVDADSKLSPVELITLIQIASAWWEKDKLPFPSIRTLAIRSGVSERQMHRTIRTLEDKGLLKRVKKKENSIMSSNSYDLSPLVSVLSDAARIFESPYKRKIKTGKYTSQKGRRKALRLPMRSDSTEEPL